MQNSICILLWIGGLCQTNRNGNRHHEFIHCMIQIYVNNRDFVSLLEKDFRLNRLTKNYKG